MTKETKSGIVRTMHSSRFSWVLLGARGGERRGEGGVILPTPRPPHPRHVLVCLEHVESGDYRDETRRDADDRGTVLLGDKKERH